MNTNTQKKTKEYESPEDAHPSHIGIIVTIIGGLLLLVLISIFLYLSAKETGYTPVNPVDGQSSRDNEDQGGAGQNIVEERSSVIPELPPSEQSGNPTAPGSNGLTTPDTNNLGTDTRTTTPPVSPPPASVSTSDVTITRLIAEEPMTAAPDQGDLTVFQFMVETPHEYVDFEEAIFSLILGNDALYGTADAALRNEPLFHFEKQQEDGSWQRLITTSYARYSGNIRSIRYEFDYGERLRSGAIYRIVASHLPCELVGNSIDISLLDSRGNTNVRMGSPVAEAIRDIAYTERAHSLRLTPCASVRTVPHEAVAWFQFEEESGTLYDSSGYNNHATSYSGLAYQQPRALTNAIRFLSGGGASYIEIPHTQQLAFSDPITVEAYISPDADGVWQGVISKGNGTTEYDYHIAISPNNKLAYYTDVGDVWYEGSTTLRKNAWVHIAVTVGGCAIGDTGVHKGCRLKMYVDGQEENIGIYSGSNQNAPDADTITLGVPSAHPIAVGAWSGPRHLFSYAGFMDELAVYKRVLSPAEILERYKGNL